MLLIEPFSPLAALMEQTNNIIIC